MQRNPDESSTRLDRVRCVFGRVAASGKSAELELVRTKSRTGIGSVAESEWPAREIPGMGLALERVNTVLYRLDCHFHVQNLDIGCLAPHCSNLS